MLVYEENIKYEIQRTMWRIYRKRFKCMKKFGKPEEKKSLGKFRLNCEGNINIDVKVDVRVRIGFIWLVL